MGFLKYIRLGVGILISFITLFILFRQIELSKILILIQSASPIYLLMGFTSVCFNIFAKLARWYILLGKRKTEFDIKTLIKVVLSGQLMNSILPGRLGDAARIFIVGKYSGKVFVLGTIAIEKWLDTLAFIFIFLLASWLIPLPAWLGESINVLMWVTVFGSIAVIVAVYFAKSIRTTAINISRFVIPRFQNWIINPLDSLLASAAILKNIRSWFWTTFWTIIIWSTAVINNYFGIRALNVHLPLSVSLVLLIGLQMGIIVSASPGAIGVFEYICLQILTYFGVEENLALGIGVLLHMIIYFPLVVGGLWSIISWHAPLPKSASER